MMLQLVQSPSQRIQRLIKTKCSNDNDETNRSTTASDKRTKPQVDESTGRDDDDADSSSLASSSNLTKRRHGRPFVTQVDELLDGDGNLIAASVTSYSSDGNNSANKKELDNSYPGHKDDDDDREGRHN